VDDKVRLESRARESAGEPTLLNSPSFVYHPEIDGLRALAIVAVILNHFNGGLLPGGFLGVDVFFVISGYVISATLFKNSDKSLLAFLSGFYSRRIKRLVPALITCVLLTSILICLFDPRPSETLLTGASALFGVSNVVLLRQATDYFGRSAQLNVFTQTWSLGVEEQFYLAFPIILWLTRVHREDESGRRRLIGVVAALAACSLAAFVLGTATHDSATFYLMPTRFWELGAGALTFAGFHQMKGSAKPSRDLSLPLFLGLVIPLFASDKFSAYTTLVTVVATALVIVAVNRGTRMYPLLTHPVVTYLGRISYSLYLWHWSVIALSRWTVGITWWLAPLQAGVMICCAVASYRYVERPLRQTAWSSSQLRGVWFGVLALSSTAAIIGLLMSPSEGLLYAGKREATGTGVASLVDPYRAPDGLGTWRGADCILSDNSQVGKHISAVGCTLGNFADARHRVLVIGNSFAAAFVQAFDRLVVTDNYAVTITSSWGASVVPEVANTSPWARASDYYWKTVVPTLMADLRERDWVLMVDDMSGFSSKEASTASDQALKNLELGLTRLADETSKRGIQVAVVSGLPFARDNQCAPGETTRQWFTPFGPPCEYVSRAGTLSRRAKLDQLLARLEAQRMIHTVDLMEVFCPRATCTLEAANGQLLYRDEWFHPSVEAARLSAQRIRAVLAEKTQQSYAQTDDSLDTGDAARVEGSKPAR
jgi:peptidoglycan/LPS O-acetylase OafA/YrhL